MTRQQRQILERRRKAVQAAVLEAMRDIKTAAVLSDVQAAVAAGQIDRVLEILGITDAAFDIIVEEVEHSYNAGGRWTSSQIGTVPQGDGARAVFRFDRRSAQAEAWAQGVGSRLLRETVDETRQVVRAVIAEQLAEGRNPKDITRRLVGHAPAKRGGPRVGGVVGLTDNQRGWVDKARQELEDLNPNYLKRELRNRALDARVKKAIKDGTPLSRADIDRATAQLEENVLRYRAENIARTESITALRAGQQDAVRQATELGGIDSRDTTKVWDATGNDGVTRDDHWEMDGQRVAQDEPFVAPDGSRLMHPGDSSLGAPPEQVINCRCHARYEIDFIGRQVRLEGF